MLSSFYIPIIGFLFSFSIYRMISMIPVSASTNARMHLKSSATFPWSLMISFGKGIFNIFFIEKTKELKRTLIMQYFKGKFFDFSETKHQAIKCNQLIIENFHIFIIQKKEIKKKKKRDLYLQNCLHSLSVSPKFFSPISLSHHPCFCNLLITFSFWCRWACENQKL